MTERYNIKIDEEGMFLIDCDENLFMPVSLEQIELLLNVQDREIKQLKEENEQLKKDIEEHSIDERLFDDLYFNQVGGI